MYQRHLNDPDGNILEFGYTDPAAAGQALEAFANPALGIHRAGQADRGKDDAVDQ